MSLRDDIVLAQKKALKDHDDLILSTARMLWSNIRNREIEKRSQGVETLNDDEIRELITRQIKQLQDPIKDFEAGGRKDLAEKNLLEINILKQYLPPEMPDSEIQKVIEKIKIEMGENSSDTGRLMGAVMKELKGKADGNRVKNLITTAIT